MRKHPNESVAFNPNLNERETARVEIFSDAVFAIVITLLILDIQIPAGYSANPVGVILSMWPKIVAYLLSFLTIGVFWISHHNIFNFIKRSNRYMMWLNLVFLMFVALIPFPTKLISEYRSQPASGVVYGLILTIINCMLYIFWVYASRKHKLISKELPHEVIEYIRLQILLDVIFSLLAILASYLYPNYSLLIYGIVVVRFVVPSNIRKMIKQMRFYKAIFNNNFIKII